MTKLPATSSRYTPAVVLEEPTRAIVERKSVERAQFAPVPIRPTRDQKRVGSELVRVLAAEEATYFATTAAGRAIARLTIEHHEYFVRGVEHMVAVSEEPGRSKTAQEIIERGTARFCDDHERHLRGNNELGAYTLAHLGAKSFDLAEDERGWLARTFGPQRR